MLNDQQRERLNRRLKIEHMLESWQPPSTPSGDEICLTDQQIASLTKREQNAWRRIRKKLGSNVISISRVRSELAPRDQDFLYRILQQVMKQE